MNIKISEIFSSIQGEGLNIGKPALFVRFHGCNLQCSYCDTPYTWKSGENKDYTEFGIEYLTDVIDDAWDRSVKPLIVFTGGEPLLYFKQLLDLMDRLNRRLSKPKFEIETNGTINSYDYNWCSDIDINYNVSPKLENSGVDKSKRFKRRILESFPIKQTIFKFVVKNDSDVYDEVTRDFYFLPKENIIIQPEGVTAESQIDTMRKIADACKFHGFRLIPRLHTLIWDSKRGV